MIRTGTEASLPWPRGEGEAEDGSGAGGGFHPYSAAVLIHDSKADGQADAASLIFARGMDPLEEREDLLPIGGFDADAVVGNGKYASAVPLDCADMDTWNLLPAPVFQSIADEFMNNCDK